MQHVLIIGCLFIVTLAYGQRTQGFIPTFKESKKTTHKIPRGQQYTFGYLEVLENRNTSNQATIQIPVYIFKSRSAQPKADPIIYTVGGPGSTTMPSAQYMNYYKYLDDRDFILVEQRGNYYAKPHLGCPEWSKAVYQSNLPGSETLNLDSLFEKAAKACKERLAGRGIDLDAYNTTEIAADIADLVEALEIETYNLLTISYSTKIAQVLMRDYPEKIRSVVMDSALPLEVSYDEESIGNLLESLDKLLTDCEKQEDCDKAYPDIKNRFHEYLVEKTRNPLLVTVENPKSGKTETFKLTGKDLITVFTSASTGSVPDIPLEISKLLEGDLTLAQTQLVKLFSEPNGGAGIGMRLSVWCAEEYPFVDQAIVATETFGHPEVSGLSPAVFEANICNVWGVKSLPEKENEPIESDIPVLLLNGEYDNETPPKWATQMSKNLSNSYHLVFKGWKHTVTTNWQNQCAMQAANDFFNNPQHRPEPKCLDAIETPIFTVK